MRVVLGDCSHSLHDGVERKSSGSTDVKAEKVRELLLEMMYISHITAQVVKDIYCSLASLVAVTMEEIVY